MSEIFKHGWQALGFKSNQDYLNSYLWKETKKAFLMMVEHKCEKCGATKNLDVHHKSYFNAGNEDRDDLMLLCRKCHEREHGRL